MTTLAVVGIETSPTDIADFHRELTRALGRKTAIASIDSARWGDEAIAAARSFWTRRMIAEHRSVGVFLLLGAQLVEANAPLDAKTVMLRLAQDELRHTELCGRMVRALGGEPAVEMDVSVAPLATHAGSSLADRALRNVVYATCLSEMIAVARLIDALEHTEDESARSVTRAILADEVLHGTFGFHYLDAVGPTLDDASRESLARYLQHAFAVLERELVHSLAAVPRPSAQARALGVIDPVRARDVFYQTIEVAVVPGLERHRIAATDAWRCRAISG